MLDYNFIRSKYKKNIALENINTAFDYLCDDVELYNPIIKKIIDNELLFPETETLIRLFEYLLSKDLSQAEVCRFFIVCKYVVSKKIPELYSGKVEDLNIDISFDSLLDFIFNFNCTYDFKKLKKLGSDKKITKNNFKASKISI